MCDHPVEVVEIKKIKKQKTAFSLFPAISIRVSRTLRVEGGILPRLEVGWPRYTLHLLHHLERLGPVVHLDAGGVEAASDAHVTYLLVSEVRQIRLQVLDD